MTRVHKLLLMGSAVLLLGNSVHALDVKSFSSTDKWPEALDLRSTQKTNKLKKLSLIQWHSINGNWKKCVDLSNTVHQNTSLGVWLAVNHLFCLNQAYTTTSGWKVSQFLLAFKKIEFNKSELLSSPYKGHRDSLINVFLDLAKLASEKARNEFEAFVDRNHDLVDYMNEAQRASYYKTMGEYAWLRQKNILAKNNFLRSYSFKADPHVLKRLQSLKADGILRLDKYQNNSTESEEESKLWGKVSSASRKGQTYKLAQNGVDFLSRFPGSVHAEEAQEKISAVYKRLLYRRGDKYVSIKKDFENQLMKAPPQNILFWATVAYERGYQQPAFKLAEKAADKWEDTPEAAEALIIAARSAYYTQRRSQAKDLLNRLIDKHSGHEASFEAQYLLGLLLYREGEYKRVINLYDSFLTSSGSDKWELQARYWLWRSLKKIESSRSKEIAETIFKTFPLTYYGLLVRMEEKKGLQNLISDKKVDSKAYYWWTSVSKKRWTRIKNLIEAGWLDAAETEIDFLPDPQTATGFHVRAKLWEALLKTNRSVQDYASAIDLDLSYINQTILNESFPQKHKNFVEASSKEFKMSKELVWSIMRQESAFVTYAVSPSNAYGLMQLLGNTAKETAKWLRVKRFRVQPGIFDPKTNIRFGAHFISRMVGKYKGVIPLAVASYNVGPGNLDRWLSHRTDLKDWDKIGASPDDDIWMDELPWAETSFYVKAVMRNFLLYKIIHEKMDSLPSPPWGDWPSK